MIEVNENLKEFAKLTEAAGHKTYVVGGYVRNSLMGISLNDVDIAGSMPVEDVETICGMAGFHTDIINKKLGTIQIIKDSDRFEYTTFRQEVYDDSGKHKPDEVKFVTEPKQDAVRRDFTINAMYYDILNGELLDFFGGKKDIKRKVIKTVVKPKIVFDDDGLRVLRLVRFICELGFKPHGKTYKVAKACAYKVKDISAERILKEIKISVGGGLKYGLKNETHANVVKYYNDMKLWQYIFKGNFENFKVKPSGKFYTAYLKSDASSRYVAFMCMVLNNYIKVKTSEANLTFSITQLLGKTGLKESNKTMQEIFEAYSFAQKLVYLKEDELITNANCIIFDRLSFEIKNYLNLISEDRVNKIKFEIMQLKKKNVPFKEEELLISNKDLIEKVRVNEHHISKIKSTLFEMCVEGMIVNDRDILLEQAKFLNEKLLKILASAKKRAYEESSTEKKVEDVEQTEQKPTGIVLGQKIKKPKTVSKTKKPEKKVSGKAENKKEVKEKAEATKVENENPETKTDELVIKTEKISVGKVNSVFNKEGTFGSAKKSDVVNVLNGLVNIAEGVEGKKTKKSEAKKPATKKGTTKKSTTKKSGAKKKTTTKKSTTKKTSKTEK